MANEFGAFLSGGNLILRPNTTANANAKVCLENNAQERQTIKTHNGYTNSGMVNETYVVSTTDNTATVIASIPAPVGYACSARFPVMGIQDDATDAVCYTGIGCCTNNAGTTAMKGTALYQVVESNASADCAFNANDTSDTLEIKVTGITAENWAWQCQVQYSFIKTSA